MRLKICDIDKNAIASYQANHPYTKTICKDICELNNAELKEFSNIDILLGGPPCRCIHPRNSRALNNTAHKIILNGY
ncbi:DNA cytosine methyltransferase [Campylobacter vulpis]|uniref:Uncharacterized protein n=1 Tax=Campylobacter vulpis TaxID=1655500 RepID=A0A2G4R2S1_9BACT|nr:DNA cytosine methyltransferase [Campylobacter vulpis]PHY89700.1 hypothetical protein AA995_07800 [Campylobacter vulpis]PHY90838.1 hypothetical protein AA994_04190 [Campylobacter vulpis]